MIGDDELAVLVRALAFQLVEPTTGNIVAQLGIGPGGGTSLLLYHNDALTTDSYLQWTQPTTPGFGGGTETLVLSGPTAIGGTRPYLAFSKVVAGITQASLLNANAIALGVVDPAGVASIEIDVLDVTKRILMWAGDGAVNTANTAIAVVDVNGAARGTVYGVRLSSVGLGAGVTLPLGATNLMSLVLPNMPIGGTIDIVWSVYNTVLLAGGVAAYSINVNGNPVGPRAIVSLAAGEQIQVSNVYQAAVVAGTHTITLVGTELANNNANRAQPGDTVLKGTVYA